MFITGPDNTGHARARVRGSELQDVGAGPPQAMTPRALGLTEVLVVAGDLADDSGIDEEPGRCLW